MDIRLPRLLMAILSGAMLGMAGAAMQSITRNGLADPGLIGVKEGCSAAVLLLIFSSRRWGWLASAGRDGRWSHYRAAGGGAGPRYLASAFYSDWDWRVMGFLCGNGDLYDHRRRARCADGDAVAGGEPARGKLDAGRYRRSLAAPAFALLLFTARAADVALLGSHAATGLGVRTARLALLRVLAPVVLTAACVSCVGSIGFVGLIAPHMARLVMRGGQTALLMGSAVLGALLVLLADTVGRLAFLPLQLPAGIVISLIGGPFSCCCSGSVGTDFRGL